EDFLGRGAELRIVRAGGVQIRGDPVRGEIQRVVQQTRQAFPPGGIEEGSVHGALPLGSRARVTVRRAHAARGGAQRGGDPSARRRFTGPPINACSASPSPRLEWPL